MIKLENVSIGDLGVGSLSHALHCLTLRGLKKLVMKRCGVTAAGVHTLADEMNRNPSNVSNWVLLVKFGSTSVCFSPTR